MLGLLEFFASERLEISKGELILREPNGKVTALGEINGRFEFSDVNTENYFSEVCKKYGIEY